jgi:adenosylmethionine-8-amino-7-oxononanoate aminotransferase
VDDVAFENGLITYSTMPTRDGFAGDQSLFAPPFTSTDAELDEMVERFTRSVRQVAKELESKLEPRPVA